MRSISLNYVNSMILKLIMEIYFTGALLEFPLTSSWSVGHIVGQSVGLSWFPKRVGSYTYTCSEHLFEM